MEQSITRKSGPTLGRGLGVPTLAAAGVKTYLTRGTHVDGYIMREWESLLGGERRDRAPGSVPLDSEEQGAERALHIDRRPIFRPNFVPIQLPLGSVYHCYRQATLLLETYF